MESNLNKIAQDLYGKIQTRFPDIKIGDENAEVLSKKTDIPKARFFEFDYKEDGETLGTVTITLDNDEGVVIQISGDLAERKHPGAFKFLRSFRKFAKDRLLKFDVQNIGKSNLDKRDYAFQAKRKEETVMPQQPVMESKLYGTSRMSYQDLGEARLVIKHTQPVNQELAAGRTLHIDSIYVENSQGERFKYPFKHLNGARALAEHLKHGGIPYDAIGKHIISLSEELAQLRKYKSYVSRYETISEAMGEITDRVMDRIEEVKKEINLLQRPAYYETFAESFEEKEDQSIPEDVMSDWIDRLTIRTFNEELKTAFPYIFRLVGESQIPVKEVDPDELLDEYFFFDKDDKKKDRGPRDTGTDELERRSKLGKNPLIKHGKDYKEKDKYGNAYKISGPKSTLPEDQFESFLDSILEDDETSEPAEGNNTLFSRDVEARTQSLADLKDLLSSGLKAGPGGMNAITSLKGIIDSEALNDELKSLDGDDDAGVAVKIYLKNLADGDLEEPGESLAKEIAQEIVAAGDLDIANTETPVGGDEVPEPEAPAPEAPPEPAPEAPPAAPAAPPAAPPPPPPPPMPMAETTGENSPLSKIIQAIHKAKESGATLETQLDFGHSVKTIAEVIGECGMEPQHFGFKVASSNPVEEMWKTVEGFLSPETQNFTIGGTRAKIKILKGFRAGEFPGAKAQHVKIVLRKIDELDPSDPAPHVQHGEHDRLRHLAGVGQQSPIGSAPADGMAKLIKIVRV